MCEADASTRLPKSSRFAGAMGTFPHFYYTSERLGCCMKMKKI